MAKKQFLCTSKNGHRVVFDPIGSHVATHFDDTPQLAGLVKQILENTELTGEYQEFETDMGKIVGTTDEVETDETDEIVYAKRKNRDVYTPFTKSRKAVPSSLISVSLDLQPDGTYELFSAWIGSCKSPDFPGSKYETAESKKYWTTHALVWGNQAVQEDTITSTCPW